jgi:predicted branched-subunit amino acid permease
MGLARLGKCSGRIAAFKMPRPVSQKETGSHHDPTTTDPFREDHASLLRERDMNAPASLSPEFERAAWREGLQTGMPALFGIGAWGLVLGVAMVKSGLTVTQACGMTLVAYAGSAQLASLPLIAAGAPVWVIFATALVVNLRFVIFSALLAPHFSYLPWPRRAFLGYISGDLTVALFLQRYPTVTPEPGKLSFLKGLMIPNWFAWQIGSFAGIFLGSAVPTEWQLGFAGTLAILCIMVPLIVNSAALCGVAVAAVVAVLANGLPFKLGLLLAVLVGMLVAMAAEEIMGRRKVQEGGHHG